MYNIVFSPDSQKAIKKWIKSNPNLTKKFEKLLIELSEHPRTGTGHPEALKGGGGAIYSRRISQNDRLIYDIEEEIISVLIIQIEGHYGDK